MYSAFFQGISPVLPIGVLLGAVLLSLLVAYFSYRDLEKGGPYRRWTLISLRAASLIILIFLLLNPFITFENSSVENPQIAVYLDNSRSITVERGEYGGISEYREILQEFRENSNDRFEYTNYLFESEIYTGDEIDAEGSGTDLHAVINHLRENENRYKAALLFSDGISTMGRDPAFAAAQLSIPVFTVPLGDTTSIRDIAVSHVDYTTPVYTNTNNRITAEIRYQQTENRGTEIRLIDNGALVETREILFQSDTGTRLVEFDREYTEPGLYDITVEAVPLDDEFTADNNRFMFTIEALEDQTRILSIAFEIHPDVAAIRNLIGTDIQNELINATWTGGRRFAGTDPFDDSFDVGEYDLLILHGLPPAEAALENRIREISEELPVIEFSLPSTYREESGGSPRSTIDVRPVPVSEELSHPLLELTLPSERILPPLKTHRGGYDPSPGSQTLLNGSYQGTQTPIPLLAVEEGGNRRKAALNAYGWFQYKLSRQDEAGTFFKELITNLVSWTATPPDSRRLIIEPVKRHFTENESVRLRGTLMNERGDPEPNGIIELRVLRSDGQQADGRNFRMRHNRSGSYTADIGQLPEGSYDVEAEAVLNNRVIGTDKARLIIGKSNIELVDTRRNDATLRNIAGGSGGLYLENRNVREFNRYLTEQDLSEPVEEITTEYSYIRELPAIWFLLVIALLTAEWLIRRSLSLV